MGFFLQNITLNLVILSETIKVISERSENKYRDHILEAKQQPRDWLDLGLRSAKVDKIAQYFLKVNSIKPTRRGKVEDRKASAVLLQQPALLYSLCPSFRLFS